MKVFNLYMKIIKKNLGSILVYFTVFAVISIVMTMSAIKDRQKQSFQTTKTTVAFYDEDNTKVTQQLKKQIEKVAEIEPIQKDSDNLKDALFFRKITAIIKIEKGFTQKLENKEAVRVIVNAIPNTYTNQYVEMEINSYLDTISKYQQNTNLTLDEILQQASKDLEKQTSIEFIEPKADEDIKVTQIYFNYLSYILLAILILGISTVMGTIQRKDVRKRTICSPITSKRFHLELTLGHFIFCIVSLLSLVAFWAILKPQRLENIYFWLYSLNAFCLMLAILSIGFLIGTVIQSQSARNAAANVISLGTSFICGVFVPMEWLSSSVLTIASFTPNYWYIKANTLIQETNSISMDILSYMAIQLGFAVTFWLIALVIAKSKRTSEQ